MSCPPSSGTGRTQLLGSKSPIQAKEVLAFRTLLGLGFPFPLLIRILLPSKAQVPGHDPFSFPGGCLLPSSLS